MVGCTTKPQGLGGRKAGKGGEFGRNVGGSRNDVAVRFVMVRHAHASVQTKAGLGRLGGEEESQKERETKPWLRVAAFGGRGAERWQA